jgi:hypothetical protein
MAIHRHLEPANRSSYTGSLPCLSYSRSMISSIIATNETLCYLLEQLARQRAAIENTRYCPGGPRMLHSGLYGKSRPALAESYGHITISNIRSHGQKPGISGANSARMRGPHPPPRAPFTGAAEAGKKGLPALDGPERRRTMTVSCRRYTKCSMGFALCKDPLWLIAVLRAPAARAGQTGLHSQPVFA